jgi:putative ABC transport system permease protein
MPAVTDNSGGRVPLAWLNLTHDPRRSVWALLGVAFAVFLMFVQTGFDNGIYDSLTLLVNRLDGDLYIINSARMDVTPARPFPRTRLWQARGVAGVAATYPIYLRHDGRWRTLADGQPYEVRVVAYDPDDPVWTDPLANSLSRQLRRPETCIVDSLSNGPHGALGPGQWGELQGRRAQVIGSIALGTNLVYSGTVFLSTASYVTYMSRQGRLAADLDQVELGLVKLRPGAPREETAQALRAHLPDDVEVLDKEAMAGRIRGFWLRNQPIGQLFLVGTVMGFLIGVMICYQVLFTEIHDQLPQYATLKAIGYDDRFLVRSVLRQSLLLGAGAFAIGAAGAVLAQQLLRRITGFEMALTPGQALVLLVLTLAMCALAGRIAVREALRADPAEVF